MRTIWIPPRHRPTARVTPSHPPTTNVARPAFAISFGVSSALRPVVDGYSRAKSNCYPAVGAGCWHVIRDAVRDTGRHRGRFDHCIPSSLPVGQRRFMEGETGANE